MHLWGLHFNRGMDMKKQNALLTTLIISGLIAGCAKERPEEFGQGQGSDLLAISEFQGKTFEVATANEIEKTKISRAQNLKDENIPQELNNMSLVNYSSSSPLLNDVPLRAKANTIYKFNYELTDKYLILNKISTRENLPFQEITYAKKIGDNLYSVPMIGYPISLIRVENVLDGNGDKTHRLSEFSAKSLEEATHFKVDKFNRVVFDAIKKNDVFPTSIFEGEWFYAATIVSAGLKNATSIGRDLSVDFEAESVSRIKFIPTPNSVRAVNTNLDSNIDRKDTINMQTAVEIPVTWVDFRVEKNGRNFTMREERLDDSHKDAAHWSKRGYAEVNFANVKSILTNSTSTVLENVELSEGFLSFTVHYTDQQIKIKYALKKAHAPKAGRIYRKEDRKLFGLFDTTKHFIDNHRFHRDGDYEKQIMMNRFYPEINPNTGKKEIRYFFSSNTPENMRNAGKRAIHSWNETFKAAGSDIEVILDESKSVSLGDIRYNIINIVDTKDGSGLLGYGPSIVDSESGEIISATTNIYANPFREGLINSIRNYVKNEIGLFNKSKISTITPQNLEIDSSSLEKWSGVMEKKLTEYNKKASTNEFLKETDVIKGLLELDKKTKEIAKNAVKLEQSKYGQKCNFSVTNSDVVTRIKERCNDEISEYIDQLKSSEQTYNERELEVIGQCAEKLLEDDVVATLVHEMGHNLGLRHNFLASTDKENFKKDKNGKLIATSSTMDYSNGTVAELLGPGRYDEEVIRFAYANKITLEDDSVVSIDPSQSLKEQLNKKSLTARKFKFCTDENVDETDPLCQRWDYGTNPKEVVQSIINNFNASFEINGHRHDRAWGPNDLAFTFSHLQRTLLPLKKIHDQWRYHLAEFVTKRNQYLESFSEETFNQVINAMKADTGIHGENYRKYYEANVLAFNFLKNLLKTPARYCMVSQEENSVAFDLVDFERLKDDLFKENHVTVRDCSDPLVVAQLKANGLTFIKTVGEYMNPQKVTLDITDPDFSKNEAVGLKMLRRMAAIVLEMRNPIFKQHQLDNFAPNFLDNPTFRREIGSYLIDRILNGVTAESLKELEGQKIALPLFDTEKSIITFAYEMFLDGLIVPGKLESSLERRTPFNIMSTTDPSIELPEGAVETRFANRRFIATPRNAVAKMLVEKRENLRKSKESLKKPMLRVTVEDLTRVLSGVPAIKKDEILTLNFADFIEKLKSLIILIDAQNANPKLFKVLNDFFYTERFLVERILPLIIEQGPETMSKPAIEVLAQLMEGIDVTMQFAEEGRAERIKFYVDKNEQDIANAENFRTNLIEYEAQLDMLTEIFLNM